MNAVYTPRADRLEMTRIDCEGPNLQVDGGRTMVPDLTGRAQVDLKGSLDLDWEAIGKRSGPSRSSPTPASPAGRAHWRLAGTIDGLPAFDRMGSLEGEIGVQIDSLDIFGMRLSEVPVVLRSADGRLTVDPIDAQAQWRRPSSRARTGSRQGRFDLAAPGT